MASNMGVINTGAVNAVIGQDRLEQQLLPRLRQQGLTTVKLPYPPSLGGIGGRQRPRIESCFRAWLRALQKCVQKPHSHVMFSEDEAIVNECQCAQYEHAWMPTLSSTTSYPLPVAQVASSIEASNRSKHESVAVGYSTDDPSRTASECILNGERERAIAYILVDFNPEKAWERLARKARCDTPSESSRVVHETSGEGLSQLVAAQQPRVPTPRSEDPGEQDPPVVCMRVLQGSMAKACGREASRRIEEESTTADWELAEEIAEDSLDWHGMSQREQLLVHQGLRSDACNGEFRCLGMTEDGIPVDTYTWPCVKWIGLVLFEGVNAEQPISQQDVIPDTMSVVTCVKHGQFESQVLDNAKVFLHLPQYHVRDPLQEVEYHGLPYRVLITLIEHDGVWKWHLRVDEWMSKGKRKRQEGRENELQFGQIFVQDRGHADKWREAMTEALVCHGEDWCGVLAQSHRVIPGVSTWLAQYVLSTDEILPESWTVVLMEEPSHVAQGLLHQRSFVMFLQDVLEIPQWVHVLPRCLHSKIKMAAGHEALLVTSSSHLLTRLSLAAPISNENLMQTLIKTYWESQPRQQEQYLVQEVEVEKLASMSWDDLCATVEQQLSTLSLPWISSRQSVSTATSRVRGVVLGATTRRGAHVTVVSEQPCWKSLLVYIHELARRRPADQQHPYLSVAITSGSVAPHKDHNCSMTSTLSLGDFVG
eukprot:6480780-Amphidinium_carterae.2